MSADQPTFAFSPTVSPRRWRVLLADNTVKVVEAHSFRCEHGALVLVLPVGTAAAFAPGQWHRIEPEAA